MGELTTQLSSWPGSLDTALSLSDGPGGDSPKAAHINGVIDAVLKLQADLGTGLKGSVADLKTRLAANISAVGGLLSGTVFPGSPTPLQLFWRTDTKQLHVYDDALGQWQRVDSTNVHSALSGLLADDHPQYAEIAEVETISGAWNFTTAPSLPAGSIGSTEIADGSIVDADVSPSAGIVDTKLATIATPGRVSDTALSSNIARLNVAQTFTQAQTIKNLFPQFIVETTGQTAKARIIQYDSRVFMSWNGYRDAAGWQRDDTAFSSWLFGMGAGNGDIISAFHSPAGTGLVVFVPVFSFDSAGKMTGGTVPLARIASVVSQSTATLTNTFALGSLPVGTFIHLVCNGSSTMPGAAGSPHSYFNLISSGTAILKSQGVHSQDVVAGRRYDLSISSIIEVTATSSISVQAILTQGTSVSNTITAMTYKP